MPTPRIAYLRVAQETNAFSPIETGLEDFRRMHFVEGPELAARCAWWRAEVPGLVRNAELSGFVKAARRADVRTVPVLSAWAMPSGPVSEAAFCELSERALAGLRQAGPLDGVFVSIHGAMRGAGAIPEPEEVLLEAIRELVGPEVPIAVTIDLHAQLTARKVAAADILVGYRTNPHRDLARTGERAGELLIRLIAGEIQPCSAWRSLPMVEGGGSTIEFRAPMRPIFARMKAMERRDPRVLCCTLCMVHPWNDSPDLGWSVHVITDGAPELAEELADELAELAWGVRVHGPPELHGFDEGLRQIREAWLARRLGTVCVVDASDVVGAGGTGENTQLLRGLLAHAHDLRAYLPIRDAQVVEQLWGRAPGSEVELEVGGRIDPARNEPVAVRGQLATKQHTENFGKAVVLDLGHVQLVVTEAAPFTLKPAFYAELGLDPWRADLVVMKSFFHFRVYYAAVNRKVVRIKTAGATDFELSLTLDFNDAVYPKDDVGDWREADRRRRGVAPG